jgi:hypothetical protein
MKTQKMTLWQWIKSLFVKKAKQESAPMQKQEPVQVQETINWNEPIEVPEKKMFDGKTKQDLVVDGKTYHLTEKQMIFYNAIVKYQKQYSTGVLGWRIAYEFLKAKHNLSENELGFENDLKKLPKWKFSLSSHNKTMKYLINSGLVTKNNSFYKAKV